jgi:hypothetical protein
MTHRDEWNVRRWIKPRILPADSVLLAYAQLLK